MQTNHTIIIADSRDMREVQDESVHLVVTSPPYWQLKDYGHEGQIGFDDSYEAYINNLNLVWAECDRVLHPGCRLCVNIGDQFARAAYYGRYKIIPIRTEIIRFCETIGFDYMGAIIWQKVTTVNTSGGATIMGSFPYPRNGIVKLDYEFILLFKKPGKPPKVSKETKEQSRLTKEEWNTYFYGHWNFPGEKQQKHLAMFPEELPTRLIRMFSFVGDTALDPFLGSGTTTLAARNHGRHSIGYEINPEFLPAIEAKLGLRERGLFADKQAEHEVIRPVRDMLDSDQALATLPYLFRDPVKVDKKVDPRKQHYGSKINGKERAEQELRSVASVDAANRVTLDNGIRVVLIGIVPREETQDEAMQRLREMTDGQRVFLKHDPRVQGHVVQDDRARGTAAGAEVPAYLCLKNKTHVNLHLVRSGLVDVDTDTDYKAKTRFVNAAAEREGEG